MTTCNARGQDIKRTEDQGGDSSVERTTTAHYADNGRPVRIDVTSDGNSDIEFVITNTYDANDRLIEQMFDGIGVDVHDFHDSKPPPIGVTPIYRFDPQRPYWGIDPALTSALPPTSTQTYRRTLYVRDNQGRVIHAVPTTIGMGLQTRWRD